MPGEGASNGHHAAPAFNWRSRSDGTACWTIAFGRTDSVACSSPTTRLTIGSGGEASGNTSSATGWQERWFAWILGSERPHGARTRGASYPSEPPFSGVLTFAWLLCRAMAAEKRLPGTGVLTA